MANFVYIRDERATQQAMDRDRQKQLLLRFWIFSGLFFMALPGTLLGFSNLLAISAHHGSAGMSPAWMEGHGHAQMFGWIGSFILGIGFYSQPGQRRSVLRLPLTCWVLWTTGVLLRWIGNIYEWHWRSLLAVSSTFELIAVVLFLAAASGHKRAETAGVKERMPAWMVAVMLGTAGMTAGVTFNFIECLRLALRGSSASFPHALDQKYLLILGWGFVAPMVWGFSARWLPAFLGLEPIRAGAFLSALGIALLAVVAGVSGFTIAATSLLCVAALVVPVALRLTGPGVRGVKVRGVHPSYSAFLRICYGWLIVAAALSLSAALSDVHGGIWGASRHALTVGFAATMVFSIGPRILPNFSGVLRIFSTRLMLLSLLLLQIGCTLRVSSEPLAYEGVAPFAWHVLPVSGFFELAGVLVFALNLGITMATRAETQRVAAKEDRPA